MNNKFDLLWDDNPVDVTQEANFIWSIANKLRGTYMPDKYGDVIIPMTIIRRFECAKLKQIYFLYNIFSPLKSVRPVLNSPNEMAKKRRNIKQANIMPACFIDNYR